jgi:inorganic phosphate transporter, PiT family
MGSNLVLVIVIAAAVAFTFTNGFHDTANMATSIATGALKPIVAVLVSAVLNFVGAFISISVATTIAKGIVPASATAGVDGLAVVEAALIGAMTWNLITWYFTIPSSSSHALIGGLIGAAIASVGSSAVSVHGIVHLGGFVRHLLPAQALDVVRRWDAPADRPSASAQPHPRAKRAPLRAPRPVAAEASRAR